MEQPDSRKAEGHNMENRGRHGKRKRTEKKKNKQKRDKELRHEKEVQEEATSSITRNT